MLAEAATVGIAHGMAPQLAADIASRRDLPQDWVQAQLEQARNHCYDRKSTHWTV